MRDCYGAVMHRTWPLLLLVSLLLLDTRPLVAAPTPSPLPVQQSDPTWGDKHAPVTIMGFSDLQCPFCDRALATLHALRKDYGAKKIRIVHKHFPLSFHKLAQRAAEVGAAVQTLEGSGGFFDYQDEVFEALKDGIDPIMVVRDLGMDTAKVEARVASGKPAKKVGVDVALGKKVGVKGTPAFFVNGVFISGAQAKKKFAAIIDAQLTEAAALRNKGVPASRVSERLTRKNFATRVGQPGATVWKVPIDKSPGLGPKTALVTMVMFSDFECPYCARLMATIAKLRAKYGRQLRVVFKHNPLSFHARADEASQLAIEAFARGGDVGFWRAADKLFTSSRSLTDADLERIAIALKLDPAKTMAAVRARKHRERIEADQLLAKDVGARGTPASYINGRKLNGAAALERFEKIIDEEIVKAKKLVARGVATSRVYAHIMKTAKGPPPPPKKSMPKADKQTPTRGPKYAKVTIVVFVDFESGFWARSVPALRRIAKHYGNKVRFEFRHKPLPFHKNAMRAHAAAQEAFAQKGNDGFWKMYARIADNPQSLDGETLLEHAVALGMRTSDLETAWTDGRHDARITADIELANDRDISSVPAFLINGFYLNGSKSFLSLKRVVDLALE